MNSKDAAVLGKLQKHTASIMRYCGDCRTRHDFEADPMRVEATIFNLMQIGELSKTALSDETRGQLTMIPWQQLYGMRNRIVHGYSGVNMQIVWDTVAEDIPKLNKELERILQTWNGS